MTPTSNPYVSYLEEFWAFYRGRFAQLTNRAPLQGIELERLVNRLIETRDYAIATETLVLGILIELTESSAFQTGERIQMFSEHAKLTIEQVHSLFGKGFVQDGQVYVSIRETPLNDLVAQLSGELVDYVGAYAEPLLRAHRCTAHVRSKVRLQAETAGQALFADCEVELLRSALQDDEYLARMRQESLAKMFTGESVSAHDNQPYTQSPLSRAERQQLIHRVMVGLPFEDALRNLVWRRFLSGKKPKE